MAKTLIWNITKDPQALTGYSVDADSLAAGRGWVVEVDLLDVLTALGTRASGPPADKVFSVVPVSDSTPTGLYVDAAVFTGGSTSSGFAEWKDVFGKPSFEDDPAKNLGPAALSGTENTFARGDHVHTHGEQGRGTQHTTATAPAADGSSPGEAGFMSAADKDRLDKIRLATASNQAEGALPSALGTAAWGASTDYAAADHVHAHGDLGGTGLMHGLAVAATTTLPDGTAGFMSGRDKKRIDQYLGRYDIMISKNGPFEEGHAISEFYLARTIRVLALVGGDVVLKKKDTDMTPVLPGNTDAAVVAAGTTVMLVATSSMTRFVGAIQAVEVG